MLRNSVYIYLNDIITASKDTTSHMETLKSVLKRLQEVGLKLKLTKCELLKPRIKFLGDEVDENCIHTMDDKIVAVAQFPQHKAVENVRSFIISFPFIKNFANPLIQLLKKDTPFYWGSQQESSFKDLKHALTHAPVLVFPNFNDPFIIFTDGSVVGIGAVVMQTDSAGKQHVIVFTSRALTPAEKKKKLFTYSLRDSGRGLGTATFSRYRLRLTYYRLH